MNDISNLLSKYIKNLEEIIFSPKDKEKIEQ